MTYCSGQNTLHLHHDQAMLDNYLASGRAKYWAEKGHPFKVLDPENCREKIPILKGIFAFRILAKGFLMMPMLSDDTPLVGGAWCEPGLDKSGDIGAFCKNLEKLCLERGVQILTGTEVRKLNKNSEGMIENAEAVRTQPTQHGKQVSNLKLEADVFVICTGVESAELGKQVGVNLPVYPFRGSMVTLPVKVAATFLGRFLVNLNSELQTDKVPMLKTTLVSMSNGVCLCPMQNDVIRAASEVYAVGFDFG